ncbi:O-antigen translocase [Hafnia paralvei]|uniref:O-antigen translocase n=1 Tax=Hafnia paralvei TaxID=546367 RepID=UPI00163C7735|nr:O-antigen translocase [Hafnia paralvei]
MKKIFKVTFMTGILTFIRMFVGFIIAKVVAIYTGPAGMAMLGQVQSVVSALTGIASAPVGSGLIRYTAEYQTKGYEACSIWWRSCVLWVLWILAIIVPIGLFFSKNISLFVFKTEEYSFLLIILTLLLPLSAVGTLVASVINAQQNYRKYFLLGIISTLVSSIIMVIMIINYNLAGALFACAVQTSVIGLIMLIGVCKEPWIKWQYWWGGVKKEQMMAIGGYILMAITSAICTPLSLILVRNILVSNVGWDIAGQWQAVWKISEVYLGVITIALGTYYLPRLSSMTGVINIREEINQTSKIIVPLLIILAVFVYLLRDIALSLLFTSKFGPARDLFSVQLIGDVIKIISWLYAYPMISRGATRWYVATEIFFSLTFVLFTLCFVKFYGVHGANFSYAINYCIYFIFVYMNLDRISK